MARTPLKNKILAQAYIKNGMNASKTIRQFKPHLTKRSSQTRAVELLHNEGFKKAVLDELNEAGLTEAKAAKLHTRNAVQEKNLPASNTALDMYYKIKGEYAPEKKVNINLNLTGEELKQRKKELLEELTEVDNA